MPTPKLSSPENDTQVQQNHELQIKSENKNPQTKKGTKRKIAQQNQVSLETMIKKQRISGIKKQTPELPDLINALAQQVKNNNKQQIQKNITDLGRQAEKLIPKNDPLRGNLQEIIKKVKSVKIL